MATSKLAQVEETAITFLASGGTVVFTPTSLATLTGRQSAQHDFGTSARTYEFAWRAFIKFSTIPVVREEIQIWIKTSDGIHPDNDDGTGDLAVSSIDKLSNLKYIGSIVVDQAATGIEMVKSGVITLRQKIVQVVFFNKTVDTLSSTAADNGFILTPIPSQGQAT